MGMFCSLVARMVDTSAKTSPSMITSTMFIEISKQGVRNKGRTLLNSNRRPEITENYYISCNTKSDGYLQRNCLTTGKIGISMTLTETVLKRCKVCWLDHMSLLVKIGSVRMRAYNME